MYVLVTGGFDPLHSGHLNLLSSLSKLGKVVVGLNSDAYLIRKKGTFLLPREERSKVVNALSFVYEVLDPWSDHDDSSIEAITRFSMKYAKNNGGEPLIFANGGDVTIHNSKESEISLCTYYNIGYLTCVGGEKVLSSSKFLEASIDRLAKNKLPKS